MCVTMAAESTHTHTLSHVASDKSLHSNKPNYRPALRKTNIAGLRQQGASSASPQGAKNGPLDEMWGCCVLIIWAQHSVRCSWLSGG